MSSYEDYSQTSATYDQTRSGHGSDVIRSALAGLDVPLEQQVLVDAGCGTGQYAVALIDDVCRIEAIDVNEAMLAKAKEKLPTEIDTRKIRFHQAPINKLPLPGDSADAVMVNQVLHHLNDNATAGWPAHRDVLAEIARVLKPGGAIIINSCSHLQLDQGFWFYRLIPEALTLVKQKVIDLDALDTLLCESGFDPPQRQSPLDLVLQGSAYFDALGILDPNWRSGDSIWKLVTIDQLQGVLKQVENLSERGGLDALMRQYDEPRSRTGQLTFTYSHKKS
jgi:ubiquinone/menaquinone biosynthesis C-methylase UbiE